MSLANILVPNNYRLYIDNPTFTGDLVPATDNTYDIGSSALKWKNTYSNGLFLQTTGGTASNLNYYEVYTHVTTFTGPYAAPVSNNFIINRIGNICVARIPALSAAATSAATISITTLLPARFRPISVSAVTGTFLALDNSAAAQGRYQIVNTGDLIFGVGTTAIGNYTNTGNAGLSLDTVLTWTIN
jgi:hypothetical protein